MSLSDAFWIAAAFAVICAYYIGEKIIDIDFSCFLAKNRKKAKYERLLAKRETPLANMGLRRNIRNAYENVLCPLAKADKSLLPIRMDKTFRRSIELQIDSLARHSLYRDIRVADLSPGQKIEFRTWEDDGREWREAELECCALERLISAKNSEVEHEIYRKHACLRVLQSRHVQTVDCGNGKKTFYAGKAKVICPSCGAEVTLSSQQVVCEYCGARIQTDFYDWQTEVFEIYEHIGNNLRKFLLLLGCMTVLFLSEFLCLYLIKDTEISLAAGVGTAILVLAVLTALAFARKLRHDKLAKRIELYSENYLRSCITEALYKDAGSDELLDYSVGTIILKKVVNTEDTITITADVCVSETYLPENKKPYTKKTGRTLTLQRARHPDKRKTDGKLFIEKDCPSCGANFIPDEKHCCSFCGYSLDADNAKWVVLTADKKQGGSL